MLPIALLLAVTFQAADSTSTAFIGVNVVRSDRADIATNQTVIVEGERIAWLGPSREAILKSSTRRIDARGKYLLSGFADMHVHIGRGLEKRAQKRACSKSVL